MFVKVINKTMVVYLRCSTCECLVWLRGGVQDVHLDRQCEGSGVDLYRKRTHNTAWKLMEKRKYIYIYNAKVIPRHEASFP